MAWCYELRGSDHRLVEVRSGFNTETEARNVGQRVKRKIDCIRYAKPETLTLVTKEHGGTLSRFVGMPSPDKWLDLKRGAKRGVKMDLKYRWQQRVLHAFLEHVRCPSSSHNIASQNRQGGIRHFRQNARPHSFRKRRADRAGRVIVGPPEIARRTGRAAKASHDTHDKEDIA